MRLQERIRRTLDKLPPRGFWPLPSEAPDFSTNDYLGLNRDGVIRQILQAVPAEWLRGGSASRYLGGEASPFAALEALVCALWGPQEEALLYPSGLVANLTFWSVVPERGDTIVYDRRVHASIRQGIRLSGAKSWGFPHQNWEEAERLIRRASGEVFVAVESLYSMEGTSPSVEALSYFQAHYGCHIVVDEAHTTLILPQGASWSQRVGLRPLARLFTFGKAVGLVGAVWVGPWWLIELLRRKGWGGIYTTALPPLLAWAVGEVLRRSAEWESRRQRLWQLIGWTRQYLAACGYTYQGLEGPIALLSDVHPLPLKKLHPPTVPQPAYRLSLHAFNTEAEIQALFTSANPTPSE
ncbi:MAG: pyridoxal phosphate-dependent aminotransferase family protein [Bacteroidia bacterium]